MNVVFIEKISISDTVFKIGYSFNYFHSDLVEKERSRIQIKGLSPLRI